MQKYIYLKLYRSPCSVMTGSLMLMKIVTTSSRGVVLMCTYMWWTGRKSVCTYVTYVGNSITTAPSWRTQTWSKPPFYNPYHKRKDVQRIRTTLLPDEIKSKQSLVFRGDIPTRHTHITPTSTPRPKLTQGRIWKLKSRCQLPPNP